MADKKIKCSECGECKGIRKMGNTRTGFRCEHPDQRYIYDYFREHGMLKMPGFLGYSKPFSDEVPVKTSPAWCPRKKENTAETK